MTVARLFNIIHMVDAALHLHLLKVLALRTPQVMVALRLLVMSHPQLRIRCI